MPHLSSIDLLHQGRRKLLKAGWASSNVGGGHNLPSLVEIWLTELPKLAHPAHPSPTFLYIRPLIRLKKPKWLLDSIQGRRKVWKSGGVSIIWWAQFAHLGWDRVNWSAKIWRCHGNPSTPGDDTPGLSWQPGLTLKDCINSKDKYESILWIYTILEDFTFHIL